MTRWVSHESSPANQHREQKKAKAAVVTEFASLESTPLSSHSLTSGSPSVLLSEPHSVGCREASIRNPPGHQLYRTRFISSDSSPK